MWKLLYGYRGFIEEKLLICLPSGWILNTNWPSTFSWVIILRVLHMLSLETRNHGLLIWALVQYSPTLHKVLYGKSQNDLFLLHLDFLNRHRWDRTICWIRFYAHMILSPKIEVVNDAFISREWQSGHNSTNFMFRNKALNPVAYISPCWLLKHPLWFFCCIIWVMHDPGSTKATNNQSPRKRLLWATSLAFCFYSVTQSPHTFCTATRAYSHSIPRHRPITLM